LKDPNYNVNKWQVDSRARNQNVIIGVTHKSSEIVLLIRPAHGGYVKFHDDFEKEVLSGENSQLWAHSDVSTKRIHFGEVLIWNKIDQIRLMHF
jgi:hypothetical protein